VNGGSGSDSVVLSDQGSIVGRTFTFAGNTISAGGAITLTYNNLARIMLLAGNGSNTFELDGTSAPLNVKAGRGGSKLIGTSATNTWNLTGLDTGVLSSAALFSSVAFASIQDLIGGAGANTFIFNDGGGISGNLDGGRGGGSLDYSAYTTSVIVDLQTGTATGVAGTVAHIQNVTGGSGGGGSVYNILVGDGGNLLTGGDGRPNLLIAGSSASTLQGGHNDDILIGGTTAYDMNLASLRAIMDYWSGTSDDYATRVSKLLAGSGVPRLDAHAVTSNGGGNTLNGALGSNLYYGNTADMTDFDPKSAEVFVLV
jgi:hypothetical protein